MTKRYDLRPAYAHAQVRSLYEYGGFRTLVFHGYSIFSNYKMGQLFPL